VESVPCIFNEAFAITMSPLLLAAAITIAHTLPLNSPLLQTYDYIGTPNLFPPILDQPS
jgi:hypothetical protein